MKSSRIPQNAVILAAAGILGLSLILASCGDRSTPSSPPSTNAPVAGPPDAGPPDAGTTNAGTTNAPGAASTNAPPTNAVPDAASAQAPAAPPVQPPPDATAGASSTNAEPEGIQVSFQGANIDMIVQWLAQTTGKNVIKPASVQCQLTIVSSKKVSQREAIDLVYQALAIEGVNVIENATSILILRDGQDLRLSPQVVPASDSDIPEGRQRLVKIFQLRNVRPADLREKIRPVLSDKATVEVDERSDRLLVTDFNENIRLLTELINELDVASIGNSVIDVIPLKHAQADEVANLIGLILNAQSGGGGGGGGGAPPPRSSPSPMPPGMPMQISMSSGGPPSPASGTVAGDIRIWPDRTANRLIIAAPQYRLDDVRKLVLILDKDKPEDVAVRVIPLRNVQAADLVREIAPLYQRMSGTSLNERIEVAANERSNSLIVLSSESNFQAIQSLIQNLDTDQAQELVIRTFPLKNADAQDVAKQLQELAEGQDSSSRYPYYIFYSSSSASGRSKKISVVADRRRNAVVVQAPPHQIEGIERMVKELDEPVNDDSLAPRIFHLKYVSAIDIEDVLNELFLRRQERNLPYWYYDDFEQQSPDRDVGRLYGKVRITSEPYSNTLIVTSNSRENLAVVEDILKQLDVPSQAGETTLRLQLRFAKAPELANRLNILFAKNGSPPLRPVNQQPQANPGQPQPQQQSSAPATSNFELGEEAAEEGYYPWLGGQPDAPRSSDGRASPRQVSDLIGRVRVVPDTRVNALLVSANVHLLPQIVRLVQDLDIPTPQVLIECRIIEVSSDALDRIGVRWSPDGSQVFTAEDYDGSIISRNRGQYTTGFGGRTEVNNPAAGNVASMITSLRSGLLDSTINLDVLIQFLRKNTDATVLAEPQINVEDNEVARLFVGQQVPFIDRSQTTDVGALNQTFQYKPVGVILEVTPHINADGDVSLRIRAEASAIQPGQTLFGGAILDTRNFRTEVTARSGEILVLGGIIQKQISDTVRKVPVLGDIPGLKWAFRKKDKLARDVQLMVFLRPKIIRTVEEARAMLEEIDTKAPLLREWKNGIYPPVGDAKPSRDATENREAEGDKATAND